MKYIKVSCDVEKPGESMDWNTSKYFELGWELGITHLWAKRMISTGQINPQEDILVVSTERSFLYENVCKVMPYSEFIKNPRPAEFHDLTDNCGGYLEKTASEGYYTQKYKYYEEDKHLINNINYNIIEENEPFFVIHARRRNWVPSRNFPVNFWKESIDKLYNKFKIKCYAFGEEADQMVNNVNIFNAGNLKNYASLMHHKNCKFFVGTMSGGSMMHQLCCNKDCKVFIIQNHPREKGHPLFHDDSLNFSESPTYFNRDAQSLINHILEKGFF